MPAAPKAKLFKRILIANRGEIACRVIETAQSMGIECVAVYSDADINAKHRMMADASVHIGAAQPSASYLRGDMIVQAALDTGAEAIHPGYGFLSENPEFVEMVEAAGLTFVGPSAQAIRAMGLKDAAKALMEQAGVPVVPGYHGANQDAGFLAQEAGKIGYPVLIKAVAGGGGKGMRRVNAPKDFAQALESARSEAQTAFGNADVLIEKYVAHPRHIEVQVFGDGSRAVHLFERDCSLQRRHQKVIEEAPAPGMTQNMRAAMGQAAVRAAEAIGYSGAGTVEFIVDGADGLREDGFFFMEMNTRLQVEHPVTEAIMGIDLVAWQLRVAAGAPLPLEQSAITMNGHAFEARLYAEDVPAGFLPAIGRLSHLAFPDNARADSGVRAGDEISPFYDPMIAKLVVHGETRAIALQRLRRALGACEVAGTVTNLGFLGALAAHDGFGQGEFDTGLIERDLDALTAKLAAEPYHIAVAAMVALKLENPSDVAGFTLWHPLEHRVTLEHAGQRVDVSVQLSGPDKQVWHVGESGVIATRFAGHWIFDGLVAPRAVRHEDMITVFEQFGLEFRIIDPLAQATADLSDTTRIDAPMPGAIKLLDAKAGQQVFKGARLAVLEAMKMEHALLAARDGIIEEVMVNEGDQVIAGATLIRLKEEESQ